MFEVVACFHSIGNPLKNIIEVVFGGFPEESGMISANRFQTDDRTLQRDRGDNVQRRSYRTHSAFLGGSGLSCDQAGTTLIILHLGRVCGISTTTPHL